MKSVNRYFHFGLANAVNDRRRIARSFFLFLYLIGAGLQPLAVRASFVGPAIQETQQTEIEQTISDLESFNPFKREAARNHILVLGDQAIEPIMSLLKRSLDELTDQQDTTISASQEKPFRGSTTQFKEPNWSLIDGCCYFLGRMRVVAAVPLFIRVIETRARTENIIVQTRIKVAGEGDRTTEVEALKMIGPAAEPALLRELRTPRWALDSVDIVLPNDDPHTLYAKEHKVHEIRIQVLEVLSVIGNEGTIAALESLLDNPDFATAEDRFLLEHTIPRIRNRPFPIR